MSSSDVTVIIPYYDGKDSLQRLGSSIKGSYPVIVVSNSPQKPVINGIKIIDMKRNAGFSHAANRGALEATTKYLLFANPDVFLEPHQVQSLVTYAEKHSLDAVSPTLVGQDGVVQDGYHQKLPSFFQVFIHFSPLKFVSNFFGWRETLPGAVLLIRREVWQALHGWDERFWLWWEDSDLSVRLQAQGWKYERTQVVQVLHQGGETFTSLHEHWRRQVFFHSLRVFAKKHFWRWQKALVDQLTYRFDSHLLYPVDTYTRASVVVPNMRYELLERFLSHHKPLWDWVRDELIVVTSAKGVWKLRAMYPDVIWIVIEENAGFAHTVNIGLRRVRGEWVGTVNDDVQLPKNFVKNLVQEADKETGTLQPQVVSPDGVVESFGVTVDVRGKAWGNTEEQKSAQTLNGAAFLIHHKALQEVGLFDERFGSYLEDVDLGLRLAEAGWVHVVVPKVQVVHQKHQTSQHQPVRKVWQDVKNWWLIVLKPYWRRHWRQRPLAIMVERGRNVSGLIKALAREQ